MATDPSNSSFTAQQRYFITDHLGSTRVVLNNAGSVLERYDYYPYGEKIPVLLEKLIIVIGNSSLEH